MRLNIDSTPTFRKVMASHSRFPGVKTPNGVYGAQFQHPPHLLQNPAAVGSAMPTSAMAPPNMSATSVYGVQPGHQVREQLPAFGEVDELRRYDTLQEWS